MKDMREALMVGRNSEGRLVRRPLSPHLQVYRPQITTVLSIFHRATGIGLAGGTLLLVWWLAAAATSDAAFATVQAVIGSIPGLVLLFLWTLALFFHLCNGARHLLWDVGLGFEKSQYYSSGQAVIILSGVLTVLAWVVGLLMG
ncbi:MAG: succinate dehydrogenase, cytochrome b556 subunit [Acetobacteraceae bacterium]